MESNAESQKTFKSTKTNNNRSQGLLFDPTFIKMDPAPKLEIKKNKEETNEKKVKSSLKNKKPKDETDEKYDQNKLKKEIYQRRVSFLKKRSTSVPKMKTADSNSKKVQFFKPDTDYYVNLEKKRLAKIQSMYHIKDFNKIDEKIKEADQRRKKKKQSADFVPVYLRSNVKISHNDTMKLKKLFTQDDLVTLKRSDSAKKGRFDQKKFDDFLDKNNKTVERKNKKIALLKKRLEEKNKLEEEKFAQMCKEQKKDKAKNNKLFMTGGTAGSNDENKILLNKAQLKKCLLKNMENNNYNYNNNLMKRQRNNYNRYLYLLNDLKTAPYTNAYYFNNESNFNSGQTGDNTNNNNDYDYIQKGNMNLDPTFISFNGNKNNNADNNNNNAENIDNQLINNNNNNNINNEDGNNELNNNNKNKIFIDGVNCENRGMYSINLREAMVNESYMNVVPLNNENKQIGQEVFNYLL